MYNYIIYSFVTLCSTLCNSCFGETRAAMTSMLCPITVRLVCDVTYEADADWPERAPGSFKLEPVSWSTIMAPAGLENP